MSSREESLGEDDEPIEVVKARRLAAGYRLHIAQLDNGRWRGTCHEFPGVVHRASTPDQCERKLREAIAAVIAQMLEDGEVPPPSGSARPSRSIQMNFRITEEERDAIQAAARRVGFAGLSDFARTAVLEKVNAIFNPPRA